MKICNFSDVHWGAFTSVVRMMGAKYSLKLEYLIKSLNWVNQLAIDQKCDFMICPGDFFDKTTINDLEFTALKDINWNNLKCYFLVGNHESSVNDLRLNLAKALESERHIVINEPTSIMLDDTTKLSFVPYVVESNRKPLNTYISNDCAKHIVISHNDIAGIQYGSFTSVSGFSKEEIENNCSIYINGHLHNSERISDKILNVGSLTAHNFTNDSSKYSYGAWILDTDTLELTFFENPYSLNFYKLTINSVQDLEQIENIKNNSVLSLSCKKELLDQVNAKIDKLSNKIITYKILLMHDSLAVSEDEVMELRGTDHIQRFIDFCHEKIGNSKILEEELFEICK